MAKTASVVICLLALVPSTAAAAESLPNPQGIVAKATSAVQATEQAAVAQTTTVVTSAPETVRSTVQAATSNVRAVVSESTSVAGSAGAVSPAGPSSGSGWAIQSESRNAVGRAAGAISGMTEAIGTRTAASSVTPPPFFAALPTAAELRPQAAASSAPVKSGGDGHDDPDGPGGVTGGISGPLGFVLIAAVLAGIFLMAPRFIERPLHMTSWRPRSAALALPIEWPD